MVSLVHCCVLQICCIQGTPPYPVSCWTLQYFAISAIDVDHIDTYPACAVVYFQRSWGSIVLAKIVLVTGLQPPAKPPAKPAPKAAKPRAKSSTKSAAKPAAHVVATTPPPLWQPNLPHCSAKLLGFWILPNCWVSKILPPTDSLLAPGLAVQMCLLHPRQHIFWCIMQNTLFFTLLGGKIWCVLHAQPWLESDGSLALPAYYAGAIPMQRGRLGVTAVVEMLRQV